MADYTSPQTSRALCVYCHAPLGPSDRFCSVCGTTRPTPRVAPRPSHRGFWLLLGSIACVGIVFGAVAILYFGAPERQHEQPVARVPNPPPHALAIVPGASSAAYVATSQDVLASHDRGSSWQATGMNSSAVTLAVSLNPPYVIYAAGSSFWRGDASGLAKIDARLPSGVIRAIAVDPSAARRIVAVVDGRGLYQSSDGGQSWVLVGDNVPADVTGLAFGNGASPPLFAGTNGHGVFASSDGRDWTNASGFVNGALPSRAVAAIAYDAQSGDRFVGPNGQTLTGALYVGTDIGIFKSIDGGISWGPMPFHRPVTALAVAPDGSHLVLAAERDGGIYRSGDGGVTWR